MNATVDIRVHDAEVHALVQQIYQACGMGATDAALMADSHVESDLRGAHSHGVLRVPGYVDRLVDGGVNPQGQPSVSREYGACLVVDGGNSMGQIHACRRAPGVERLYAPGELEFLQREEFARDGIPLNPVTLGDLTQTARALNVDIRPFTWLPQT